MKTLSRKGLLGILTMVAAVLCFCLNPAQLKAASVRNSDITSPKSGNVLVQVAGTFETKPVNQILDRVNQIRYEAYQKGFTNSYVPIKWSSDLEAIAQTRAVETVLNFDHVRPNGTTCFTAISNNVRSQGENIACGSYVGIMQGIELWYSEKSDYENHTSGETGHYRALINPSNKYIGIGAFIADESSGWPTAVAEFSSQDGLAENPVGVSGKCNQVVEVPANTLSMELYGSSSVTAGSKQYLWGGYVTTIKDSYTGENTITAVTYPGHTAKIWSSSNPGVATVDQNGVLTAVNPGTTVVTVSDGSASKSLTVTVKQRQPKVGSKITVSGQSYKVTKKGQEVSFVKLNNRKATSFTVPSTISYGGTTYKVVEISSNAFKNCKKLKTLVIGTNVKKIGSNTLKGCKKIKKIIVKTKKLKSTSIKNLAKSVKKYKVKVKVPKSKKKVYKKIFKKYAKKAKIK